MSEHEFTLSLRLTKEGIRAETAYRSSLQVDATRLAVDIPVHISVASLLEVNLDPVEYGRRLTTMVFADQRLRIAWASARGALAGNRLHFRLDLDPNPALQRLFWETLQDPLDIQGPALCLSQNLIVSRTANSVESAAPVVSSGFRHSLKCNTCSTAGWLPNARNTACEIV